ncbi:cystathionine gamma-synthase [Irpex rosettiformis]|uniref:Cystathionine gamma-synthase n=1 Tax=Irpex rosettiformis TaxID=378272 RepID=A0ACB8UCM0_9APHY|nr:cystathionine gamma-synthase [Irpex rosettiformis]
MSFNKPTLSGTDLIHADDHIPHGLEVAPSISVTTTFRNPTPWQPGLGLDDEADPRNPANHVYSRYTQPTSTRAEHVLSKINKGYALTYASGLAASYAAMVYSKPKRIAITGGYHGVHMSLNIYKLGRDNGIEIIDIDDEYKEGDLVWLETPLNPTGESRNIKYYADRIHAVGGKLVVDSTFGPPPLQYPFKWGTDIVLHSATKYFGGHSDLLAGVLVVESEDVWKALWNQRTYLGSMAGSLESWLLLRSLRTLHLRVPRQSENAISLVSWLAQATGGKAHDGIPAGVIDKVWHSSLQGKDENDWDPKEQLEGGWNATFAILLKRQEQAALLPHKTQYLIPATSLGGVESLIEHRIASDSKADPRLVRLSIGVEDVEDLKDDLRQAFQTIVDA